MIVHIVALLDRPGPDDYGMVGLVVSDENGGLHICGVANKDRRSFTNGDLAALTEDGHALQVADAPLIFVDGDPESLSAEWIGEEFFYKMWALDVPMPRFLPTDLDARRHNDGRGWFIVRPTKDIYEALVRWTREILLATIRTGQAEIARLSLHALPDSDDARAAIWFTTPPEQRPAKLDWFIRLDRDGGRPTSMEALQARLEKTLDEACARLNVRREDLHRSEVIEKA